MSKHIWVDQRESQSEYLASILEFLLPEYARIFGDEVMQKETCLVYNDAVSDCPMLVTNSTPIRIRLAQESLTFWAQTVYQLSHELCHYAIRQGKTNKEIILLWFEEIVCEAMSLYILYWSSKHWECCKLSSINPSFGDAINVYLNGILSEVCTGEFQKCTSTEVLKGYDAGKNREGHRNERNRLYNEIIKNPVLCRCFCDYQQYMDSNGTTIDFEEWKRNDANPLIPFLQSLQPSGGI